MTTVRSAQSATLLARSLPEQLADNPLPKLVAAMTDSQSPRPDLSAQIPMRHRRRNGLLVTFSQLAVATLLLPACIVPAGRAESRVLLDGGAKVLSQFNFRGQVQNEEGVFQADMLANVPLVNDGELLLGVMGNVDMSNDTGDAWFPDGHAGKFTQIDLSAAYSRTWRDWQLTGGFVSYILPNGTEFPNGERGETNELFVTVGREVVGVFPSVTVHYDVDEVEDFYIRAGVAKSFDISKEFGADVDVGLGFSGEDASLWTYGIDESGLTDFRATGVLSYFYDERTTVELELGASSILNSDLEDWFDLIEIESDNFWAGLGVRWSI